MKMTASQENNAVFAGVWTTRTISAPEGTYTDLLLDGNKVATFQPETSPKIIDQILAFAKCATNVNFGNLTDQIPRLFLTVNQEELNKRSGGETVAIVEVTRAKDDAVARFTLNVSAPDKGGIYGTIRAQRSATSDGVVDSCRDVPGRFIDYNKKD